jgi:NAD-dependent dihydropyrimidine dehydrogenase PreA subunit
MNPQLEKIAAALKARDYEVKIAANPEEATALVLDEAKNASSVGWGGSESVKQLGLREKIAALGKDIRDHQTVMDLFLLSANALTTDGRIVNIDGTGNRVAASIYGPKRVIYIIGTNKIVDGGIDAALSRIHREACPPNAKRLGKKTPCALTGTCNNCSSPERMCKVTAIFERRPTGTPTLVILVNAPLGY